MAKATWPVRNPPKRWPGSGRHAGDKPNPRKCRNCRISEGKGPLRPHSDLHQPGTPWTKQRHDKNERLRR